MLYANFEIGTSKAIKNGIIINCQIIDRNGGNLVSRNFGLRNFSLQIFVSGIFFLDPFY